MTEIVIADLTVDELAARLLDELRLDVEAAKLEVGLDEDGVKFLTAVRKLAHEDPQALADGFVALSLDASVLEERCNMMQQLLTQKFNVEALFGGQPEEQN